ncbi:MAG: 2-polyprenyl-6-methoxyphenol hydroxylase [Rhodospirillales bacterium]|jgi:2-polyprenyl-6-methoxyphenol hydroxylase-like FAD-dependent oxidoreductase|nr:2-polyprenyl-6-methoxyphenol hydroxylase [Rhodospirillales bacterium]
MNAPGQFTASPLPTRDPSQDSPASPMVGDHAIVIGAGMGGLAAAGSLAGHFRRVTVLERDELPLEVSPRPGVPQSRHLHGLLDGGLRALCAIFPGFDHDLIAAGAVPYRVGLDRRDELPGYDPFPQRDLGWVTYTMSRPLVEGILRQRVMRLPNVTLQQRCRVLDIVAAEDGSVAGVTYETTQGAELTVPADLVVDASARGKLTPALLRATGRPLPELTTIGIDMKYATAIFAIPKRPPSWKVAVTYSDMPANSRSGYVMPIEGGRWIVLLTERHGGPLPPDIDGFLALARQLRTTTIYEAIKNAKPLDKVHRSVLPESSWLHYERLADLPRGLLLIGDAICRFNPIHGQGMTVATKEAASLGMLLRNRAGEEDPLAGLAAAFLADVKPVIAAAWSMAAVPDFAHPETRGERPADIRTSLRFRATLNRVASRDPEIHKLMLEVRQFIKPESALREPEIARRLEAEMAEA